MNPQLLSSLAAEHRRDLSAVTTAGPAPAARARRRPHLVTIPRFRVSWTRTTLAAGALARWSSSSRRPAPAELRQSITAIDYDGALISPRAQGKSPGGRCP
jgi:hypothetical protein